MTEQTNIFTSYNDGLKNFSEFFQKNKFGHTVSIAEILRSLSENTVAGLELYDTWLEGIHNLTSESFKLCRKVTDGKQTDTDDLMNACGQIYENLADKMAEAIRDTPFESFDPLVKELKKSADFKHNGHVMKSLIQPGIDMSISMMKLFKTPYNGVSDAI